MSESIAFNAPMSPTLLADAERYAAELAGRFPVSALKCAAVWLADREAFVRVWGEPKPEGARLHCIAQRWDAETVQLRFDGVRSEWVRI